MTATPATVLLLHTRTQLSLAVATDLSAGGFDVVPVMQWRALVEAARTRLPAAVVVPEIGPRGVWRTWRSDPALSRVPIVSLWTGRAAAAWPLAVLVRADATLTPADVKRPGSAADAVRASMARTAEAAPTGREHLGDALWRTASILRGVAFVMFFTFLAFTFLAIPVRLWLVVGVMPGLCAADVLEDVGAALAMGRRPRLRWGTRFSLALALLWVGFAIAAR